MTRQFTWIPLALGLAVLAAGDLAAQEAEDEETAGVTSHGVVHNIAEDRKVIRVGGRYEPEGLDFYIKRKFDDMTGRLSVMEGRLSSLEGKLEAIDASLKKLLAPAEDTER